ncbi:MarR family winged helix-turn-helix transcriptional regulator [Mycolicibacterium peregrinum]
MIDTDSEPGDHVTSQADDVAEQLQRVLHSLWNCYRSYAGANNVAGELTGAQLAILSELVAHGPTRVTALAASLSVRPPSITVTVDRLERMGLVTRWARSIDQREVRIDITARGRRTRRETLTARAARTNAVLAQLSSHDREALRRGLPLLEELARAIEIDQERSDGARH